MYNTNQGKGDSLDQRQRLGAVIFGKLCGTASTQKANYAVRCGKFLHNVRPGAVNFLQNVWPLCGDFMQIQINN